MNRGGAEPALFVTSKYLKILQVHFTKIFKIKAHYWCVANRRVAQ